METFGVIAQWDLTDGTSRLIREGITWGHAISPDGGKTMNHRASHWRVLWCPAGATA